MLTPFRATFQGVYLAGFAIVWAHSRAEAALLLAEELDKRKLPQKHPITPDDMKEVVYFPNQNPVQIVWDGDY